MKNAIVFVFLCLPLAAQTSGNSTSEYYPPQPVKPVPAVDAAAQSRIYRALGILREIETAIEREKSARLRELEAERVKAGEEVNAALVSAKKPGFVIDVKTFLEKRELVYLPAPAETKPEAKK